MIPTPLVTFAGEDGACLVTTATIRHGRDDPGAQPTASTLSCAIRGLLPAAVDIGSTVTLTAELDGQLFPRFVGRVSDLATGWGADVDDPVAELIAVGTLASMGRRVIGDAPWAQELDGARVNRIIGLAGVPTDPARTDPGTVTILARDVDAQPALDLAQQAAVDGGGIVWQALDGAVLYADANHRRGAPIAVVLDSCTTPLGVRWQKTLEGLVNDVRIRYGPTPAGGEQAEWRAVDWPSVAAIGTYAASLSTQLAYGTDAEIRAETIRIRQAWPAWLLSGLEADLGLLTRALDPAADRAQSLALLGLEIGDLVSLTGLPAGSPMTTALLFVEGWVEQIAYGSWRTSLVTSDYCRTSPPPRWDDVDPSYTWDNVGGAVTTTTNLVTNPSAEATSGTVVVRENLHPNPVVGVDLTGWNAYYGTGGTAAVSRQTGQTGWAHAVATSARVTWSTASTDVAGGIWLAAVAGIVPGRTYGVALQARCSKAQRMRLYLDYYTSGGAFVSGAAGPVIVLAANTVTPLALNALAPANAAQVVVSCYATPGASGTVWSPGDWLEASLAHIEETDQALQFTPAAGYGSFLGTFYGSDAAGSYGPDYTYGWAGTAHASRSQMKAPAVVGADSGNGCVVSASTDRAVVGTRSIRVVYPTAPSGVWARMPVAGLVVGRTYTLSASLYVPAGSPSVYLSIAGLGINSWPYVTDKDRWVRTSVTWTEPSATTRNLILASIAQATVRGDDRCYVDAVKVEEGATATDYFDGDTVDTDLDRYAWTGTAHASTSTREHGPPLLTWDTITCLPPYQSQGRWIDVPSSTRWDLVPAGTTWQTWEG